MLRAVLNELFRGRSQENEHLLYGQLLHNLFEKVNNLLIDIDTALWH